MPAVSFPKRQFSEKLISVMSGPDYAVTSEWKNGQEKHRQVVISGIGVRCRVVIIVPIIVKPLPHHEKRAGAEEIDFPVTRCCCAEERMPSNAV